MKVRVVVEFEASDGLSANETEEVVEWVRGTIDNAPHDAELGFPPMIRPNAWVFFEEYDYESVEIMI